MSEEPRLRIAEVFSSIQGEGIWIGTPSTFVRVSGCNLRCSWCDTPYASWTPEGAMLTIAELVEQVTTHSNKHVVITGGEPMLFEPVEHLTSALSARGHVITIETAGTIYRSLVCDLMSISPKLGNSTPEDPNWKARHEITRANTKPIKQLVERYDYQMKFVVSADRLSDLAEIDTVLGQAGVSDGSRILLMPEGTDSATLHAGGRALVPICIKRGWRLAPRLHIDLFGNSKGT